jgi:hypothetical protein
MAIIHRTTLTPTKLELLAAWLPSRPWYAGSGEPRPEKAGGFRLDDPRGEVGIEFMVITDASGPGTAGYLVPMTYRGAPLDGADHALIGTTEHGVLGRRWVYDGCHDPVLVTTLLALFEGKAQAMAQSITDTPDHEVTRSYDGDAALALDGFTPEPADGQDGTRLPVGERLTLHVHRVLTPVTENQPLPPHGALGQVATGWPGPDDTRLRAVFMTLHDR